MQLAKLFGAMYTVGELQAIFSETRYSTCVCHRFTECNPFTYGNVQSLTLFKRYRLE